MKNILLLTVLFIFSLPLFSQQNYKLAPTHGKYSDIIDFEVIKINAYKKIDGPMDRIPIKAPEGTIYLQLMIKFINNSDEKQVVDFEKFFLSDGENKYKVVQTIKLGSFQMTNETKRTIKAGKKQTVAVLFLPYPIDKRPETLKIDHTEHPINYKD
ncbi:hypothetical protein [Mesonia sp. K7]|uniref:hypothetical protein n=1 Tax=Mesonia sp. K7 TaxID=2218606 RepID=UPI0011B50DB4|nr:hypothetical protein [Mesonia sp. K7]